MAHWRERFKSTDKYLGSVDLWDESKKQYNSFVVTIVEFTNDKFIGSMGEEDKTFVRLKEFNKMMMMNKENFKRLTRAFNSVDESDFIGKQVILGVEKVPDPQGGRGSKTDGLRFSSRLPQAPKKPSMAPEAMAIAKKSISEGKTTIEAIEKKYELTKEQRDELVKVQG